MLLKVHSTSSPDLLIAHVSILLLLLPAGVSACWGRSAPKFGDMTKDYDLMVGKELVLNCTLNSYEIFYDRTMYQVNSSHLSFRKGSKLSSAYVHVLDGLTAQLRLPNASKGDSGFYYCELEIPDLSKDTVVCSSKVSVGLPPGAVTNFRCVSRYYESLTCSWDIPGNEIQSKYILYKHFFLSRFLNKPELRQCPSETLNNTSCQWRADTDPPLDISEETLTFEIHGNNSLGSSKQSFTLRHYEIFVPNTPQSLSVIGVNKQNVTLKWTVPMKMEKMARKPPLHYEIIAEETGVDNPSRMVYDAGVDTLSYTVIGLIPHILYNFSLHCRSIFASNFGMWSPKRSVQKMTLSDVPYRVPEIIPEAYELRYYDEYRTLKLYWKPMENKYFNGDNFTYLVKYDQPFLENDVSSTKSLSIPSISATFEHLHMNLSYTFQLLSSNVQGSSQVYQTVFLDREENLPKPPKDITVISHSPGQYELSWKPSEQSKKSSPVNYAVFWCSSVKPWLSRCDDGPIQWLDTYLSDTKVVLNLSDATTSFQFAVASRTANTSSGMQWASCIIPYKAALNKIENVFVMPEDSTSLKVIWKLRCDALREVVQKYEIVYCKVNKNKMCEGPKLSSYVMDASQQSYILHKLQPYSNYSIVVRAYNLDGLRSEDSNPRFQTTLEGAPSDSPWDVQVLPMPNASLHISWRPPLHPNGKITQYRLMYGSKLKNIEVNGYSDIYEVDVSDLLHFENYSIMLDACVKHQCSPPSTPVYAQTDISAPGLMDPPRIEDINSTFIRILWNRPIMANGPIEFYEIHWREVKNWTNSETGIEVVDDGLSTMIEIKCSSIEDGGSKFLFSVRAANIKHGELLYGPMSSDTQATACVLPQGLAMIVGAAIGGTLLLAVMMLVIYKVIRWMSDKIHQVKNITVRLPKGLDGLENNPLNNYGDFKNGLLNQSVHASSVSRLSYVIDESDKNRHGSGSSQYSYSSTDELLYRNSKCTKFSRKPSIESSGCSSMSSNTTRVHASSESSAESDFMAPPSPDIVFMDQSSHKNTLPVVIEAQDSFEEGSRKTVSSATVENLPDKVNDVEFLSSKLKNGIPYSKFVFSSEENPNWSNSLTHYSRNLSNSEPSVMDAYHLTTPCPPYSRVGLAKSSGDIIGLKSNVAEHGYSKFTMLPRFGFHDSQFDSNVNQSLCVANAHISNGVVILPSKLKSSSITDPCFNKPISESENSVKNYPTFLPTTTGEMRDGYIKFSRINREPNAPKPGYVTLSEVKAISQPNPSAYPILSIPFVSDTNRDNDGEEHGDFYGPFSVDRMENSVMMPSVNEAYELMNGAYLQDNYLDSLLGKNIWPVLPDYEQHKTDTDASDKSTECGIQNCHNDLLVLENSQGKIPDSSNQNSSDAGIDDNGCSNDSIMSSSTPQAVSMTENSVSFLPPLSSAHLCTSHSTPLRNGYVPLSSLSNMNLSVNEVKSSSSSNSSPKETFQHSIPHDSLPVYSSMPKIHCTNRTKQDSLYDVNKLVDLRNIPSLQSNFSPISQGLEKQSYPLGRKDELVPPKYFFCFGQAMDAETCEV